MDKKEKERVENVKVTNVSYHIGYLLCREEREGEKVICALLVFIPGIFGVKENRMLYSNVKIISSISSDSILAASVLCKD